MSLEAAVNSIVAAAEANFKVNAGDYEKGGLMYCGKCNTPKQSVFEFMGRYSIVPAMCKCEQDAQIRAEHRRSEEEKRQRIAALRINGIQDREAREKTFENSLPLPMMDKARTYVDKWPQMLAENIGLMFWGDTGNGKTYAAAAIANALIDKGVPVLLTSFTKLLNAVTGMFAEDRVNYIESMNDFKLLVIDDLGAERQSEFALEIVYTVIDNRYKTGLPMIVTTNIPLDEMRNARNMDYQRIYDRVLEMCVPLKFTGESLRKMVASEKLEKARKLFE